jgi:hypothetical protein
MSYLIGNTRIQGQRLFYIVHPYRNGQEYYATNDEGQVFLQNFSRHLGNKAFDETAFSDMRNQIPGDSCHLFRGKVARHSGLNLPLSALQPEWVAGNERNAI